MCVTSVSGSVAQGTPTCPVSPNWGTLRNWMYVPLCVWFLRGQGALKEWVCVPYRVLLLEEQWTLRNWGTECVFLQMSGGRDLTSRKHLLAQCLQAEEHSGTECISLCESGSFRDSGTLLLEIRLCVFLIVSWLTGWLAAVRNPGTDRDQMCDSSDVRWRAQWSSYVPGVSWSWVGLSVLLWDHDSGVELYRLLTGGVTGCCPGAPQSVL